MDVSGGYRYTELTLAVDVSCMQALRASCAIIKYYCYRRVLMRFSCVSARLNVNVNS